MHLMYIVLIILFFIIIGGYFLTRHSVTKLIEHLKELEKNNDK